MEITIHSTVDENIFEQVYIPFIDQTKVCMETFSFNTTYNDEHHGELVYYTKTAKYLASRLHVLCNEEFFPSVMLSYVGVLLP